MIAYTLGVPIVQGLRIQARMARAIELPTVSGYTTNLVALHKHACIAHVVCSLIAASSENARVLACRCGVTSATTYKWRARDTVHKRSHTTDRLQTTLNPAQAAVVVHVQRTLPLPPDFLRVDMR